MYELVNDLNFHITYLKHTLSDTLEYKAFLKQGHKHQAQKCSCHEWSRRLRFLEAQPANIKYPALLTLIRHPVMTSEHARQ